MKDVKQVVGRYEFVIDAYSADFRGKATLPMIGGYMLQCATKHAEERGFGYSYMTMNNRVWVLSRMTIEMDKYPQNDTIFIVKTWVSDVNRLFTQRFFSFEDEKGNKLGYAKSLWAAIDINTRKPTNVLELKDLVDFINKDEPCPIEGIDKVVIPDEGKKEIHSFKVEYSDIDINKHLNSMKYIEHLVDAFDIDLFTKKEINKIEINYLSEGKYGTTIKINHSPLVDESIFMLEMKNENTVVATSRVIWK